MIATLRPGSGVGDSAFTSRLFDLSLLSRSDFAAAEQHALREEIDLARAIVALGLLDEATCYGVLERRSV